jgi:hypothetical protein
MNIMLLWIRKTTSELKTDPDLYITNADPIAEVVLHASVLCSTVFSDEF